MMVAQELPGELRTARVSAGSLARLAVAATLAAALVLAGVSPAGARGMVRPVLTWSAPRQVDRGQTTIPLAREALGSISPAMSRGGATHGGIPITGISCPTASLCVAVDLNGNALTTRTPAHPGSWKRVLIDAFAPLDSVSCPTASFCVAVDSMGSAVTSTDPTGASAAWTGVKIRADVSVIGPPIGVPFTTVSCASAHLCVTGDDDPGEIMTSTDPTGGPAAWSDQIGIGHRYGSAGLVGASCPSTGFCATVGGNDVYATTAPTGPGSTALEVTESLEAIACGSRALCVAVVGGRDDGGPGGVWRSTDPAAAHPRWTLTDADPNQQFAVACHGRGLCVATDSDGYVAMSDRPAAAQPAWQIQRVDQSNVLSGISCPTVTLCVAGDTDGNLLVGRRPRG